ncbi:MAG: TMEM175 family protein [Gemmatimonadota bacterium]
MRETPEQERQASAALSRASRPGEEPYAAPGGRRITTLVDSTFAIVMTLLVLSVEVPKGSPEGLEEQLWVNLKELWPLIATYIASFLALGIYWMGHHTQFHFIEGVNRNLLGLNLLFLLCVSMVPFTTHLLGDYYTEPVALKLYGTNLMMISIVLLLHWRYAARRGLLTKETDRAAVRHGTRRLLVGPALYALAIGLTYVDPRVSLGILLTVPLLHLLPGPIHLHWTR